MHKIITFFFFIFNSFGHQISSYDLMINISNLLKVIFISSVFISILLLICYLINSKKFFKYLDSLTTFRLFISFHTKNV
jgi:hypothetical protein